jgi:hypothetical protein
MEEGDRRLKLGRKGWSEPDHGRKDQLFDDPFKELSSG